MHMKLGLPLDKKTKKALLVIHKEIKTAKAKKDRTILITIGTRMRGLDKIIKS